MQRSKSTKHFVICLHNEGNEASLEVRKVYVCLPPQPGDPKSMIRVIDESGEDYLYPAKNFSTISLPAKVAQVVLAA